MKLNKAWCGFFTAVAGISGTGLGLTSVYSKRACSQIATQTLDLLQTFLDSDINASGALSMDVIMGDSDVVMPLAGNNLTLSLHLNLTQALIEKLKWFPTSLLNNACQAAMWQAGIQDVLLLVLVSAGIGGAVYAYNNANQSPKNEEDFSPELRACLA